jgi:hypothetical protein
MFALTCVTLTYSQLVIVCANAPFPRLGKYPQSTVARELGVSRDRLPVFAEILHRWYAQEIGFPAKPLLINEIIFLTYSCYTT